MIKDTDGIVNQSFETWLDGYACLPAGRPPAGH